MSKNELVAVTSRSFSVNPALRAALLAEFPNARFNQDGLKFEGESLVEFLSGASMVIAGLETYNSDVFASLPNLKVISRFGIGVDNIDLNEMNKRGICLSVTSNANSLSVSELVLGYMLALLRNSFVASTRLKQGMWKKISGYQLTGKTIGIIGAGQVGGELIRLLAPFKCKILVHDVVERVPFSNPDICQVSLDSVLSDSDIVTLHIPLTEETKNIINKKSLGKMKSSAYLINTARGGLVNQHDLKQALMSHAIAGAALDVYEQEPPKDEEFIRLDNLICTPHIAGNSQEAELAMGMSAIQGLTAAVLPNLLFKLN